MLYVPHARGGESGQAAGHLALALLALGIVVLAWIAIVTGAMAQAGAENVRRFVEALSR